MAREEGERERHRDRERERNRRTEREREREREKERGGGLGDTRTMITEESMSWLRPGSDSVPEVSPKTFRIYFTCSETKMRERERERERERREAFLSLVL